MSVPFLDLARLHGSIRGELDEAIDRVVRSSSYVGGAEVEAFEEEFARAHGVGPGAACGSGTDSLALALRALGVGSGDEVIVPSMTFVATAEAVVHAGATPVVADVDPVTLLLTPATADRVRTSRTRAVIPVHLYGHVVPASDLAAWRDATLVVIEDAAQAHLATNAGTSVGSVGHAACFSFYPGKNLGAMGDGGMVLARDADVVARVRRLRDHGRATKYEHDELGWCSRLDGLQAAILRVKLQHLAEWIAGRRSVAAAYRQRLSPHLVPWDDGAVHHLMVGRFLNRDQVASDLRDKEIGTGVHYPLPLSQQPWLRLEPAPMAERAAREVLSLPMDPLMTLEEVELVSEAVLAVIGDQR